MKTTIILTALLALAAIGAPAAAIASPETDLLFATPHFERSVDGEVLGYEHETRSGDPTTRTAERIELKLGPSAGGAGRAIEMTTDADGPTPRRDRFDGMPGNPLLMVFLEDVVKTVGAATGGSPFYLRNRIKDALRDGIVRSGDAAAAEGAVLTIRPFERDANRARLGPYAALELDFVVKRAAPGMLTRMTARAASGADEIYFEEIRLAEDG